MKKLLLLLLLGAAAAGIMGCEEQTAESSAEAETTTTAAETTVTEAVTTTAAPQTEATAETTAAAEYLLAEDLEMFVDRLSVRSDRCSARLTNLAAYQKTYTFGYRVLYADTERECRILSDYDPEEDERDALDLHPIKPGEKRELKYDWTERYGDLEDGEYILELAIGTETVYPEEGGVQYLPVVVRSTFEVEAEGFVPHVYIAPEDITPTGVVITIENSGDAGRSYAFVYKLFDETEEPRKVLLRKFDLEARLSKNYYVKAGETMMLELNWRTDYGSLLEGQYSIEIELLADGEKEGKTYRASFEIA